MKLPEKFVLAKDAFLRRVVELKDPLLMAVWLYGSAARGDVSERHSDMDFLVLVDGLRKKTGDNIQKIAAEVTAESKVNAHVEIMDYLSLKEKTKLYCRPLQEKETCFTRQEDST